MKVAFSREDRIFNALIINTYAIKKIGFMHGKMGLVVYYFYLGKYKNNSKFTSLAERLLDHIIELLHDEIPISFANGITGIGWAIEHIIQNKYVNADADDVLADIDERIRLIVFNKNNDIQTVVDIGYYLYSRLNYRTSNNEDEIALGLKKLTALLIDEIALLVLKGEKIKELADLLQKLNLLNISNDTICKLQCIIGKPTDVYIFPYIKHLSKDEIDKLLNEPDIPSKYAGYDMSAICEDDRWGLKYGIAGIAIHTLITQSADKIRCGNE